MANPSSALTIGVIGAGIGGLVAALELGARGHRVIVIERQSAPGGKIRQLAVGPVRMDAGPTILTLRWVFEEVFAGAGLRLEDHLTLVPATILGRHAWPDGARLDLVADLDQTADGIGRMAGSAEARRYREFCRRAGRTYHVLRDSFLRSPRPSLLQLMGRAGWLDLWRISPYTSLWRELGRHFHDPRLRQLFGRYAGYCGSSPFRAPATLMLVAHVEREGVWLVAGGLHELARRIAALAADRGARFHYGRETAAILTGPRGVRGLRLTDGTEVALDAVVVNGDAAAVAGGLLGPDVRDAVGKSSPGRRSLSALTWCLLARGSGMPLVRHHMFHGENGSSEFHDTFVQGRLPRSPSVYLCAQDRGDGMVEPGPGEPERFLAVVNAPPAGDQGPLPEDELLACESAAFGLLERCGLHLQRDPALTVRTTPADFASLFPATGGALYGEASHSWWSAFRRPGARTRVRGLYLAGGSTHPGAGVPMAALSGRLAARCLEEDLAGVPSP